MADDPGPLLSSPVAAGEDAGRPPFRSERVSPLLSLGVHAGVVVWLAMAMAVPGGPGPPDAAVPIDLIAELTFPAPEPAAEPPADEAAAPPDVLPAPPEPPPVITESPREPAQITPPVLKPDPPPKPKRRSRPAQPSEGMKPHRPAVPSAPTTPSAAPLDAPAPAAAPPSIGLGPDREGALRDYGALVWARITKRKPTGITGRGTVEVTFEISPEGSLVSLAVTRSSGVDVLDQAAVAAVRAAAPFPRPPAGASAGQLTYALPFKFH